MNLRIDNVREDTDAQILHGNDIRRSSSGSVTLTTDDDVLEKWVARWAANANSQSADDEEDNESSVDGLEGSLDVHSRTDSLGSDDMEAAHDGDTYNPIDPATLPARLTAASP